MQNEQIDTPEFDKGFAPKLYGIAVIVAAVTLLGLWMVTRYVSLDIARDMRTWQEKLNLIAESRAADLNEYVADHFKELHTLSDNPSLQLYMTELQSMEGERAKEPPAQLEYLRNLVIFTAQRGGYMPALQSAIAANVESDSKSGLAVLGNDNEIIVSTAMPQGIKDLIQAHARMMQGAEDKLIDIAKDETGALYMGYIVPVFSIQGERNNESMIGKVVAIHPVDEHLLGLLKHPGVTERTLEAMLVRAQGDRVDFLSPLADKTEALTKQINRDASRFVEAALINTTGNFIPDMRDYSRKKVLATSRTIAGTPWVLIVKVEEGEAMAASTKNRNSMIALFVLVLFLFVLTIVTMWWHASSKRSLMLSSHYRELAAQSQAQESLLRLVSNNQPEPIFILDHAGHYQFANLPAVESSGMSIDSVVGKHVKDVRGSARAMHIMDYCQQSLNRQQVAYHTYTDDEGGALHTMRAVYIPVSHIPVASLPQPTPGVLVVEQDITEVISEREKRIQVNQDLINTLVTLVDRRDPFAANHSMVVSGLAHRIALQMGLDEALVETTRIAAMLMNIGKIVISAKLLTKTDALTEEERGIIRDSMFDAAELVRPIHFDGPVYDTLRQWQEKWDGTGALGLQGEDILISARILAVANTFIGMISPRSWRNALSKDDAITFLMNNCTSLFDRRVVVALVHFLENKQGEAWLAEIMRPAIEAA